MPIVGVQGEPREANDLSQSYNLVITSAGTQTQADTFHMAPSGSLEMRRVIIHRAGSIKGRLASLGLSLCCDRPCFHTFPHQCAASISKAHGPLPLLHHSASSKYPAAANTWQVAQGLLSARTASCRFPGTGCVFSSEGPVGSVTSLAGI